MNFRTGFDPSPTSAGFVRQAQALEARARTSRSELVTGLRDDPAAALAGMTAPVEIGRGRLEDLKSFATSSELAAGRFAVQQTALGHLREAAVRLANDAAVSLSAGASPDLSALATLARGVLADTASALNASHGGLHVFAGNGGEGRALAPGDDILTATGAIHAAAGDAVTGAAAVRDAFGLAGGVFETQFYVGGPGPSPRVEIAPGVLVGSDIRADNPVIRDLLSNIAVLAFVAGEPATSAEERRLLAQGAIDGLRQGADAIGVLSATIGVQEARLAEATARGAAEATALETSLLEQIGRDQTEAAAEVTAIESQIELLFTTTARLSRLSLVNFLR